MKKVLVIAYYFPPLGMSGVRRVFNFCKFLPKFGWEPIVLTVKDIEYFAYDYELMNEVKCKIFKTSSLDPLRLAKIFPFKNSKNFAKTRTRFKKISNFLFIPDNKIGWLPYAVAQGLKIIKTENINLIFSTAPPYTSLLAGYFIKKITKLPLITEFRDPWPFSTYSSLLHQMVNEQLKKKVLTESNAVITVNKYIESELLKTLKTNVRKFTIIPHGYNPEDFKIKTYNKHSSVFTITYTGSFTKERTPVYLLKAIAELISEEKIKKSDLRIELIGLHTERERNIIEKLSLEKTVYLHPYLSHQNCIQHLINADILWITTGEKEGIFLPSKIGEYLGARKPILATVAEGSCAELIRNTGTGIVVPPKNIPAIKEAIYEFYLKFKNKELIPLLLSKIEKFSYINLTKELAQVFNKQIS